MYKLQKYYQQDFDPQAYREAKYSQQHIAGPSIEDFKKQTFWPILQKYLEKGKRYLDVGCGVGGWILFLTDEGYGVEGVDSAPRVIRSMTEYNPDLKLKVSDLSLLPYSDDSFDGLTSIGSLEYMEDSVEKGIQEMQRIAKPGAFVFVEAPSNNALRRLLYIPLKKIEAIIKNMQGKKATFSHYLFTLSELKQMVEKAGFEVIEVYPHELPKEQGHYGLYTDWKILRGKEPYQLNALGLLVQVLTNAISPWIASTGMVLVLKKK